MEEVKFKESLENCRSSIRLHINTAEVGGNCQSKQQAKPLEWPVGHLGRMNYSAAIREPKAELGSMTVQSG